ncbi:vasoactive intestinal polypeptide receptor 2 isoform X10 [Macaca fascicularis]|uniref:vasoactive intestinal polypeptide receptor 2 isoform X10 n=1 Tax=Macaca fascicularis TaxID=9541 RepID=UPI003D154E97
MRTLLPPALLTCWLLAPVNSIHPECRFHLEIQEEETKCAELLRSPTEQYKACSGVWDNITCWRPANVGETVTVPCPKVFSNFYSKAGNISKNCTSDGWSETFPDFVDACGYSDPEDESKLCLRRLLLPRAHSPQHRPVVYQQTDLRPSPQPWQHHVGARCPTNPQPEVCAEGAPCTGEAGGRGCTGGCSKEPWEGSHSPHANFLLQAHRIPGETISSWANRLLP